jgi:hypothetical protein
MSGGRPEEIHQFEYRWLPARDFYPIASSDTPASTQWWYRRLAGQVIRAPRPESGAPADAVVYQMFDDGMAALVWRQWNADAMALGDGTSGREPLVARILVGADRVLTPEVAMAACRAGLPAAIGPLPGQVPLGAELPLIASDDLSAMVRRIVDDLDAKASIECGLDRLIAAALSDYTTPLGVQLPEHSPVLVPQSGPQALLLWGLWRTAGPLLADLDPDSGSTRGWSFSTYELPFDQMSTDPRSLPEVVFRDKRMTHPAPTIRKEITVRPRDFVELSSPTAYDDAAGKLVTAYQQSGAALTDRLGVIVRRYSGLDRRLEVVRSSLLGRHGAAPTTSNARPSATPSAPVRESSEDHHERGEPPPPGQHLPILLAQLYAGPGHPSFAAARQILRDRHRSFPPEDRAAARELMAERGWYLPALTSDDHWHVEDTLERIFLFSIIPDLGVAGVSDELASWIIEYAAPAAVIQALLAAARHQGGAAPELMERALAPALNQRWLTEHRLMPLHEPPSQERLDRRIQWRGSTSGASASGAREAKDTPKGGKQPSGHVFISYVREDSRDADRLQQVLEKAGVRVWRDTENLWPGWDWQAEIKRAITDDAFVFLACFSKKSLARDVSYQNEELALAIDQLRLRRPGVPWLIPVRFDDCHVPDLPIGGGRSLASIHRADLFGENYDKGAAKLVGAVLRILDSYLSA